MSEDFYKILGVPKTATKADIKRAYRSLAQKHHPDKKGGNEKEFKKVNEAYEVLSDDQKRSHYDQFGSTGGGFSGASHGASGGFGGGGFSAQNFDFSQMGGMGGMEDIFSSFFGGGRSRQKSHSSKGADLEVEVEIDFDEAMKGTEKTFSSHHFGVCETCSGKGGTEQKKCSTCGGKGSVAQRFQTPFGVISQSAACPDCHGEGTTFEHICASCHGEGRRENKQKIDVRIPAGVSDGATLRVSGSGEAGRRGGGRGDLYVHVRVRPSRKFERRGNDILSDLHISVFDAIKGGKFEVETFWKKMILTVPENTRDGQMLRIFGEGVKTPSASGDHLVRIHYEMPKRVSSALKELLEKAKREG